MTWLLLCAYLVAQLALGLWLSRSVSSENDFFLAGRRLGVPLVTMSLFATWFGAETCLGAAGAVYGDGLAGGRADPFGYSLCLLLMGLVLAVPLHRGGYMTLGDLYRERWGATVERAAVLVLIPSSIIWGAAQVRAFGQVLAATTDLDVTVSITLATAFVIAYTYLGGLMGDVVTDLIQGGILAVSLLALLGGVLVGGDGSFAAVPPVRWNPLASSEGLWTQLDRWAVPILGSLVAQELIARVLAARSASTARFASFAACGAYLVVGAAPILLGLLGPQLVPALEDPEQLLPMLAKRYFPHVLFVLFSGALISAILSTVDSILLSTSGLVSHNVLVPVLGLRTERSKLLAARLVVVAAGIVSLLIALRASGVYQLVEAASAFGTAGILVTTLVGLHARGGGPWAALAALVVGLVATPTTKYLLGWSAPFITSIAASAVAFVMMAVVERRMTADAP